MSSERPGVGNVRASASRNSWVSSWSRQCQEVCAVFGVSFVDSYRCPIGDSVLWGLGVV
jgi:hypothetical protein